MDDSFNCLIITVSDRCSAGQAVDESSAKLAQLIRRLFPGKVNIDFKCIPDNRQLIERELMAGCVSGRDVVLTTGGTGFSERDVTPEATRSIIQREAPGLVIAMITESLLKSKHAMLSRMVCGIRDRTLIVNLPGSPKGSTECLEVISPALMHAVHLLRGDDVSTVHKEKPMEESKVPVEKLRERNFQGILKLRMQAPVIPVEKAQNIILNNCSVKNTMETLQLSKLLGRVLAADVHARDNLPPFRAAVRDGYAVLVSDGRKPREIVNRLAAGMTPFTSDLVPGTCVRVNTGGPIPNNADAVVQYEDTISSSSEKEEKHSPSDGDIQNRITVNIDPKRGEYIREIGSDVSQGDIILSAGERLGSAQLGLLATVGVTQAPVYSLAKVGVLSTGDELYPPEVSELPPGGIRDSNRAMLLALLSENNIPALDLGIAKDQPTHILNILKTALRSVDVIITTGGVSMGDRDFVKEVLQEDLGAEIHFTKVNMKPGKPTTFATLDGEKSSERKLFFCLPGNPVSAITTFHLFVLPALRKMSGFKNPFPTKLKSRLNFDVNNLDTRPEYRRVILNWDQEDGIPLAETTGSQMSSRLLSWRKANALVYIPSRDVVEKLSKGSVMTTLLV